MRDACVGVEDHPDFLDAESTMRSIVCAVQHRSRTICEAHLVFDYSLLTQASKHGESGYPRHLRKIMDDYDKGHIEYCMSTYKYRHR